MMKKIIFFSFIVVLAGKIDAQNSKYPFKKWSNTDIEKANIAKNIKYMSEICRQVVFYTNLVRIHPQLFAETYLQQYVDSLKLQKSEYVKSLYEDLKKQKTLSPLLPDEKLTKIAQAFAEESGKAGKTGHANFTKRLQGFGAAGENCSYGKEIALEIVIDLLIDEDVPTLGHRVNILSADYRIIGVGFSTHKKYGVCCVMDFADALRETKKGKK